jgi:creatinine amidohydrolase/Fe(II)-dependent formamide hydrolase-like protein
MNLPDNPAIRHAYEQAVMCLLNATDSTHEEAEAFVDAMANLIFTTMQTYLTEREPNGTNHH